MKNMTSYGILAWFVWGLGCLFYFYESILQISPSVMSHELMQDFHVTSQALGILSGIYFWSYAAMQLPAGLLMDRFGPRRLLSIATLVCGISTCLFGFTDALYLACFARLMIGFGSAFAVIGTLKLAANWFHADRFSFLTGLTVTIGMLGGICGEGPLSTLIEWMGWRHSMFILGAVGIVLAALIYWVSSDLPTDTPSKSIESKDETANPIALQLKGLLKNKQLWVIASYGALMYMTTPVFCGLWGVPYLMTKFHLSKTVAANSISLVFIGWMIASPLWGIYSYRMGQRKPPLLYASLGCLSMSLCFLYLPIEHVFVLNTALFLFGIFSAGFLPAFALAKELCNETYIATGLGFMNLMNTLGVAIAQPLIGVFLDWQWDGALSYNVRLYSVTAYQYALMILPLGLFIALLLLFKVKETYCKHIHD